MHCLGANQLEYCNEYDLKHQDNPGSHPSLKGFGTPWARAQESRQHTVLLDTQPNNIAVAVMNFHQLGPLGQVGRRVECLSV